MSYMDALAALEKMIVEARSVPLSASAVIPRAEAIRLVDELKIALPREHEQAREILDDRERVLGEAHARAQHIVEQAREERRQLLERSEVVVAAEKEARRVVEDAHMEAEKLRHEADDYADAKLANFEIILDKMMRTLNKGREQLRKRLDARSDVEPLDLEDSGEWSGPLSRIDPER